MLDGNNIFTFKSRLVGCKEEQLKDYYSSLEEYRKVLNVVNDLLLSSPGFFVLDPSMLSKLTYIVNLNRFSMEIDRLDKEKIDFIISTINNLEAFDDKQRECLKEFFLKNEANYRGVKKLNALWFKILTQYDAEMMDCLVTGKEIPIYLQHFGISFINYLVESNDSLFDCKDFCDAVLKFLSEIKESSRSFQLRKKKNVKKLTKKIESFM